MANKFFPRLHPNSGGMNGSFITSMWHTLSSSATLLYFSRLSSGCSKNKQKLNWTQITLLHYITTEGAQKKETTWNFLLFINMHLRLLFSLIFSTLQTVIAFHSQFFATIPPYTYTSFFSHANAVAFICAPKVSETCFKRFSYSLQICGGWEQHGNSLLICSYFLFSVVVSQLMYSFSILSSRLLSPNMIMPIHFTVSFIHFHPFLGKFGMYIRFKIVQLI